MVGALIAHRVNLSHQARRKCTFPRKNEPRSGGESLRPASSRAEATMLRAVPRTPRGPAPDVALQRAIFYPETPEDFSP
jgi:hypothetical protein